MSPPPDQVVATPGDPIRRQRVIGAFIGSVVGDALGAPFEGGPPGAFSARFPAPAHGITTEMCGGQGWRPGEWTDDTQMALLVAASLLKRRQVDEVDLFARFVAWVEAGPAGVGIQTRVVLTSGRPWRSAAHEHFTAGHLAAGNGSLMRAMPAAIFFARAGTEATMSAARRISDLTHGDPAAGDGCAIYHRLIAAALDGADPLSILPDAVAAVPAERRAAWEEALDQAWTPEQARTPNGAVWPTLATAVWALRRGWPFDAAMRAVIDLGGDTDTVAAVTGGLLGAVQGIQAIPSRWSTPLTGELPGHPPVARDLGELQRLAQRLDGEQVDDSAGAGSAGIDPVQVLPGLWLSDLSGASRAPSEAVVVSLCRAFGHITAADRRQVFLTDDGYNLNVDAVLADVLDTIEAVRSGGRPVLVHCYGGASRTGLVLRAWLRRTRGLSPEEATREAQRLWPHTASWTPSFDAALARVQPRVEA
jgi:ADP-ribosyl-[dinitrogen reductase] hydrolase